MGKAAQRKRERKASRVAELQLPLPVRYAHAAARILPQHFGPDCCINGTRVALEVLSRFGVTARPIVTRAMALNPKAWELSKLEGLIPEDEENAKRWEDQGAWIVQITPNSARAGYGFHVVAVAEDYLVDSASGQFIRPQKNLRVAQTLALTIPLNGREVMLAGETPMILESDDGAALIYQVLPLERGFMKAPGWRKHAGNMHVAALVEQEMRKYATNA